MEQDAHSKADAVSLLLAPAAAFAIVGLLFYYFAGLLVGDILKRTEIGLAPRKSISLIIRK